MASDSDTYDTIIVGGGPAGATVATLLRKYDPEHRVLIVEKERFPRDHIGESQLPAIGAVLDEMGVWDAVEAADFPIKLGASFTWGRDRDRWDLDFYPVEQFKDEPRPARYEGQRRSTAFQVERSVYDQILLRHAESAGVEVRQRTKVERVLREGDRITGFALDSGPIVRARHYVDASGAVGLIRRAMAVASEAPTQLRNIAIWDYWQNARWAVKIGVGGTRIQVRSLPWGWLWFIPLGPTRTSLGLVCPAQYYRSRGIAREDLYAEAIRSEPEIAALVQDATPRGRVESCKDWSHVAERGAGENWFICGEAAGFADPILSAGLTLAHYSAREVAYSILEIDRADVDQKWIRRTYSAKTGQNIRQHINFALYWYAANSCFTDLKEHCQQIARDAGLRLTPEKAWRWLAQGGFASQSVAIARAGSFDLSSTRGLIEKFTGERCRYEIERYNIFRLSLVGARKDVAPDYVDGGVRQVHCYRRADKVLPITGPYAAVFEAIRTSSDAQRIFAHIRAGIAASLPAYLHESAFSEAIQAMEAMLTDGWVSPKLDPRRPMPSVTQAGARLLRSSDDGEQALKDRP